MKKTGNSWVEKGICIIILNFRYFAHNQVKPSPGMLDFFSPADTSTGLSKSFADEHR